MGKGEENDKSKKDKRRVTVGDIIQEKSYDDAEQSAGYRDA